MCDVDSLVTIETFRDEKEVIRALSFCVKTLCTSIVGLLRSQRLSVSVEMVAIAVWQELCDQISAEGQSTLLCDYFSLSGMDIIRKITSI
jgi:hypothetical protein